MIKKTFIFIIFLFCTGFTYGYKNNSQTGKPDLVVTQVPLYKGSLTVPTYTDNGNGTITVAGAYVNLYSTDIYSGQPVTYYIAGGTFTPTDNATSYLRAYYNSGNPIYQIETDPANVNLGTHASIFTFFRTGNHLDITNWDSLGEALPEKTFVAAARTNLRYLRSSGLALSEYGTRNVALTAGLVYQALAVAIDLTAVNTATDTYELWYHSGGVWTSSSQTQYNNTQYDNGTSLATLTTNRYAVNWVYRGVEDGAHLYITLGTGDYTLAQVQAVQPPTPPVAISSHALLVGRIIVQKSAATATQIDSAFITAFTPSAVGNHADLTNLDYASAGHTGFAPSTPKYLIQVADASLPNAQATGSLGTGILKNTTTTGVLSIATAGDFPTLNQNTTGSAAKLTTARTIDGVSFDGTANIQTATANTSDYIASTWTPELSVEANLSGSWTYTEQSGYYTKIGRIVTATFQISCSAKPAGGNTVLISLPVATTRTSSVKGFVTGAGGITFTSQNIGAGATQIALGSFDSTRASIVLMGSARGYADTISVSALASSHYIYGVIIYED